MKKDQSENLPYKFWKKYEDANLLEKDKILTPIVSNFMRMNELKDKKLRQHIIELSLKSYFDDLIEYFYCKDNKSKQINIKKKARNS